MAELHRVLPVKRKETCVEFFFEFVVGFTSPHPSARCGQTKKTPFPFPSSCCKLSCQSLVPTTPTSSSGAIGSLLFWRSSQRTVNWKRSFGGVQQPRDSSAARGEVQVGLRLLEMVECSGDVNSSARALKVVAVSITLWSEDPE